MLPYNFDGTWVKASQKAIFSVDFVEFEVQLHHLPWTPFKKENGCADSEISYPHGDSGFVTKLYP